MRVTREEARDLTRVARLSRRTVRSLCLVVLVVGCRRHSTTTNVAPVDAAPPPVLETVPVRHKFEVRFDVPHRTRAPDDVTIRALLHEPGGGTLTIPGFAAGPTFAVRFAARVPGVHRFEVFADGGAGESRVREGTFTATASGDHGFVRRDPKHPHRLAFEDGTPFFVFGENRINVYDPTWNYENMGIEPYVAQMATYGMTTLRFFVFTDCEREDPPGSKQLGCLEPERGRFDPLTAEDFDRIFDAAERHDVYVIVAPWAIGFTGGNETWRSWADNPWSAARGGPVKDAVDFFTNEEARKGAEKKLRYVLARWGWSPHLLAIDVINEPEWDGPIPEKTWIPWASDT